MRAREFIAEFAPSDSGRDDGDDDILFKYARMFFNAGDDINKQDQIADILFRSGWEIGWDEGYEPEPGVFVIRAGDEHGDTYISWSPADLRGFGESIKEKFVVDDYNPETVKPGFKREKWYRGRYLLRAEARPHDEYEVNPTKGLIITVFDTQTKSMWFQSAGIARARFIVVDRDHMEVSAVQVAQEYQRQGIASAMYNFARELGNEVRPSANRTEQGRAFWAAGAGVGRKTPNEPPATEPNVEPIITNKPKQGWFKKMFKRSAA